MLQCIVNFVSTHVCTPRIKKPSLNSCVVVIGLRYNASSHNIKHKNMKVDAFVLIKVKRFELSNVLVVDILQQFDSLFNTVRWQNLTENRFTATQNFNPLMHFDLWMRTALHFLNCHSPIFQDCCWRICNFNEGSWRFL